MDACAENYKEGLEINYKKKTKRKLSFLSTVGNKLIPTSWEPVGAGETPSLFPGKLSPFSSSSILSPSLFCLSLSRTLALFSVYIVSHSPSLSPNLSLSLSFSLSPYISFLCLSPDFSLSRSLLFSVYPLLSESVPYHPTSLSACLLTSFSVLFSIILHLSLCPTFLLG